LDRNFFAKLYLAANGHISEGSTRKAFVKLLHPQKIAENLESLDRFYFVWKIYPALGQPPINKRNRATIGKLFALTLNFFSSSVEEATKKAQANIDLFNREWDSFLSNRKPNNDRRVQSQLLRKEIKSISFKEEVVQHFGSAGRSFEGVVPSDSQGQ
jgi:hypothetical protein